MEERCTEKESELSDNFVGRLRFEKFFARSRKNLFEDRSVLDVHEDLRKNFDDADCEKDLDINRPIEFVDSHCHLCIKKFLSADKIEDNDFESKYAVMEIVKRANDAGVKYMLAIGTELNEIEEIRSLTKNFRNVLGTVGIHPLSAKKHCEEYSFNDIAKIITDNRQSSEADGESRIIGIGEIGLDYHHDTQNSKKEQREIFELQLDLADKHKLPVCIHSRNAEKDTIDILKNHGNASGVIHCFSGTDEFAFNALDLGFYISISGIITFKKNDDLVNTTKKLPLDKLLIETDSPFLAPAPFRGRINEPAFILHTAQKLSGIFDVPLKTIANTTTKNFFDIFNAN
jgi:TatD DNase family protein